MLLNLSVYFPVFAGSGGYVIGWGDNRNGQSTGIAGWPFTNNNLMIVANHTSDTGAVIIADELLSNVIAVAADWSGYALKTDGTVVKWGLGIERKSKDELPHRTETNDPIVIGGKVLSNVVSIALGGNYCLALKKDGTIVTSGNNTVPAGLNNVVAISAHDFTCTALKNDGTVVGWDTASWSGNRNQLYVIPSLSNVVAIATGENRNLALKKDGTVGYWGYKSDNGRENLLSGLSNFVAVAVGVTHGLALVKDGTVMDLVFNDLNSGTGITTEQLHNNVISGGLVRIDGQILTNVVTIAARDTCGFAVKRDGKVVGWTFGGNTKLNVPAGLSGVTDIAIGRGFCLAITTNNAIAEQFRKK